MDFEIKEMTPELSTDFFDFLDNRAHSDSPALICYCCAFNMTRENDIKEIEEPFKANIAKGGDNSIRPFYRKVAERLIKDNTLKGYLAYHNGIAIGWCNTNDKRNYSRLEFKETQTIDLRHKIKAIACYEIAPQYRDKGVDKSLIRRVCKDAKDNGFDIAEAYPCPYDSAYGSSCMYLFKNRLKNSYADPIKLYEQEGFHISDRNEKYITMQKQLKS